MTGENLPDGDHVVRFVNPSMILEDGIADGSDFCLRLHRPDETGLSVNWLQAVGLAEVRRLSRLTIKRYGRFAVLNVGTVKQRVAEELVTLRILHDPLDADAGFGTDPSHAEITGLPPTESDLAMLIGDLIAECDTAMHPALGLERSGHSA